jgi:NAD(P)-dependent dehydrogenase (short-subunit alcohol dehydrogenase family)
MQSGRFIGKAVLVTGAASGIGRSTALRFAAEGAGVILADRDAEGLDAVAESIVGGVGRAIAMTFDAADPLSCRTLPDRAAAVFGRLDVLANIAGVLQRGRFEDCGGAEWDRVIAINLTSQFHIIQQALPHLIATRGSIVNMASSSAMRGVAFSAAYSASKHAVVGLTKSLAAEFADRGVRVNAICPGPVATPMIMGLAPVGPPRPRAGMATFGQPDDIAGAVLWLASDEAHYVTGIALSIDGGLTAG